MVSTPLYPMVLLIIIPMKNGYFIGNINPTFSEKPIYSPYISIYFPYINHILTHIIGNIPNMFRHLSISQLGSLSEARRLAQAAEEAPSHQALWAPHAHRESPGSMVDFDGRKNDGFEAANLCEKRGFSYKILDFFEENRLSNSAEEHRRTMA